MIVFAAACSSDDDGAKSRRDRCLRLRDHVVELRLGNASDDRDKQRVAMRDALGDDFVAHCEKETKPPRVDCMLAAKDQDTVSKCK